MKHITLALFFLSSLSLGSFSLAAPKLEIIQLNNRPAEEVLPLLRPMLGPQGSISGQGFQLIVKAEPQTLAQLKKVIAQLDKAAANLLISVRQVNSTTREQARDSVNARVPLGRDAEIAVNNPNQNGQSQAGVSVELQRRESRTKGSGNYQVRVLEGRSAWIETGVDIPETQNRTHISNGRVVISQSTQTRQVRSGFYVTPHLRDRSVLLEISPQQQTPGNQHGQVTSQSLNTQIVVPLGEWFDLGGVNTASSSNSTSIGSRNAQAGASTTSIQVKVERLD